MSLSTLLAAIGPGGQLMLLLSVGVPLLLSAVFLTGRQPPSGDPRDTEPLSRDLAADR